MIFKKNQFPAFTWKRVLFRTLTLLVLLFISESVPNFGSILDLVGGSTVTLLTFVFPPFFYMRLVDMSSQNPQWTQR
jgi:vesicular inhibitory amino acid transporter